MSYPITKAVNKGAYESPFSGTGIEFDPLGIEPDRMGLVIHETGYNPCNSDWNFPSVLSPFWRIYHNRQRAHCVVFGEEYFELTPDRIVLIPDHQVFHCLGQQPVPSFWIHFGFNQKPAPHQALPICLEPADAEMCLIQTMSDLILADGMRPSNRIYSLSLALLHVVLTRSEIHWKPPLPDQLLKLTRFIEANLRRKLPNQLLARRAGVSIAVLYRLFHSHLDTSPANYVNEIRISYASRLLSQAELSIDNIAETAGFPNRAYFSRVFKQVSGMSPAAFRNLHKK